MRAVSVSPAAPPEEAAVRLLAALVDVWPGAALLMGADGRVRAASPLSGARRGEPPPFDLPELEGAAGDASTRIEDASGRVWRVAFGGAGVRLAVLDATAAGAEEARRFTAALSHEIRTPLNCLLGMAALLEETGLSPPQAEYVAAIRKSGARLLDLLNNVLDYSRLGAGRLPLEETPFEVEDLVQDVAELIAPRAHAAGLDIAAMVDPALPRRLVGDAGRLRQILFNLAGNAVKFTERGAVLLSAAPSADGEGLVLAVRDTGVGVPHEARSRLFEAFGQARIADARKDGGVGLGLAIVAQLAQAMGGAIRLASEPGEGSMFALRLSLPAEPDPPAARPATAGTTRVWIDLKPASALACAAALAGEFRVTAGGDPADADAIILDAALPPARIAAAARLRPTLVVMRPEDRSRIPAFRDMGCVGYLIRPLRRASVVERVRLALAGIRETDPALDAPLSGAAPRVLIADDNAVNALLASRALAAAGYRVDTASTGAEALERAGQTLYSVIFMDIRMPVMDGLEAARRIRELPPPGAATPIIALTADQDPSLGERARAAGISAIANKPIDPAQLRALAATWSGAAAETGNAP